MPRRDLMGRLDPANGRGRARDLRSRCGSGNITRILLSDRFGRRPSSARFVRRYSGPSREAIPSDKRVTFSKGDLAHFKPGLPPAILGSNAAYHGSKISQHRYFPLLLSLLPSSASLSIQCRVNHDAPSHALMKQAAQPPMARQISANVGRPFDRFGNPHAL